MSEYNEELYDLAVSIIKAFDLIEVRKKALMEMKPGQIIVKGQILGGEFKFSWELDPNDSTTTI